MNICIHVPHAAIRIQCAGAECYDQPAGIARLERNWIRSVVDHVTIIGAVAAQSVAAFTGRGKHARVIVSSESRLSAAFCLR